MSPSAPGIWRWNKKGHEWESVSHNPEEPRSTPNKAPMASAGTLLSVIGAPRKPIGDAAGKSGIHLLLWPFFWGAIKKSPNRLAPLWRALPRNERAAFFITLASAATLPENSDILFSAIRYCEAKAPELTKSTWPKLRARAAKLKKEDWLAAGYEPGFGEGAEGGKSIAGRLADKRRNVRDATACFEAETGG